MARMIWPERRAVDPSEPPDWRHRRAEVLAERGARSSRRDDRPTNALLGYLAAAGTPAHSGTGRAAYEAAHALEAGGMWPRTEVRARILAGEPAASIAGRAGLSVEVVAAYEAYFFDIRGRLASRDWITAHVLAPAQAKAAADPANPAEATALAFAYFGGPIALDLALAVYAPARPDLTPAAVCDRHGGEPAAWPDVEAGVRRLVGALHAPWADMLKMLGVRPVTRRRGRTRPGRPTAGGSAGAAWAPGVGEVQSGPTTGGGPWGGRNAGMDASTTTGTARLAAGGAASTSAAGPPGPWPTPATGPNARPGPGRPSSG